MCCCHGNLYFWPDEKWPMVILETHVMPYITLWCIFLTKALVTSNFNQNILGMKDLSKNKVSFLLTFKGLSNKQTIFYFIGTLTTTLFLMIVQLIFKSVFFLLIYSTKNKNSCVCVCVCVCDSMDLDKWSYTNKSSNPQKIKCRHRGLATLPFISFVAV